MDKQRINLVLVLLLSTAVTGCMSFRGGSDIAAGAWPPKAPSVKRSVRIVTSAPAIGEGLENMGTVIARTAKRAYGEAGAFSSVSDGFGGQADIIAEVTLTHRGDYSFLLSTVSGLTFCMIPATGTDSYTLTTTWKTPDGAVIGQAQHTEDIAFWIQFFLVFGMPFADSDAEVMDQVFYDLN